MTKKVKVVAPMNMGDRLDWNQEDGKYDVNVEDLLARIVALENKPTHTPINLRFDTPNTYFNLDTDLTGLGMSVFYGNIIVNKPGANVGDVFYQQGTKAPIIYPHIVKGIPPIGFEHNEIGVWIDPGYEVSDWTEHQDYDFSGYQFATPVEIVQCVFHGSRMIVRTNDAGMNLDGTLVNPEAWNKWRMAS